MQLAAKILEVSMLVCFGISWPFNLAKSIKSRSTKGKSLIFLTMIDIGYVFGIISKIINPSFSWSSDWWVFAMYVVNFCLVSADFVMYFINKKYEKKQMEKLVDWYIQE